MTVLEYLEFTNKENDVYQVRDRITCNDGFTVSVQGGTELHYCSPRRKCNQYNEVELGYPSSEDELIQQYAENPEYPTKTVYGFVPIDIVEKLIEKHGGINKHSSLLRRAVKIRRIDMETRKCAYCGAERPVNEMAERVLVHKCGTESGRTATVRTKNWYCSDTACDERHQDKEDSRQ